MRAAFKADLLISHFFDQRPEVFVDERPRIMGRV